MIDAIEQMAYKQGFKSLKFKNCHDIIFHPTNWIAEVDYTNENQNNLIKDNEDEEYEEEEDLDNDYDNFDKEEEYYNRVD